MSKKLSKPKTLRLSAEMLGRLDALVARNAQPEADVLRWALEAGMPLVESGRYNPATGEITLEQKPKVGQDAKNLLDPSAGGSMPASTTSRRQKAAK